MIDQDAASKEVVAGIPAAIEEHPPLRARAPAAQKPNGEIVTPSAVRAPSFRTVDDLDDGARSNTEPEVQEAPGPSDKGAVAPIAAEPQPDGRASDLRAKSAWIASASLLMTSYLAVADAIYAQSEITWTAAVLVAVVPPVLALLLVLVRHLRLKRRRAVLPPSGAPVRPSMHPLWSLTVATLSMAAIGLFIAHPWALPPVVSIPSVSFQHGEASPEEKKVKDHRVFGGTVAPDEVVTVRPRLVAEHAGSIEWRWTKFPGVEFMLPPNGPEEKIKLAPRAGELYLPLEVIVKGRSLVRRSVIPVPVRISFRRENSDIQIDRSLHPGSDSSELR